MYKDLKELIDINTLRDEAYKCACEHGFHDTEHFDEHWLALIMSEVGEALNADRKNKHAHSKEFTSVQKIRLKTTNDDSFCCAAFDSFIKDSVEDELADIAIRILDLAGLRGYDCSEYFEAYTMAWDLPEKDVFSWFSYRLYSELTNAEDTCNTTDEILEETSIDIALYCKAMNIDLYTHIVWKMKYNEMRPKLNGKDY